MKIINKISDEELLKRIKDGLIELGIYYKDEEKNNV